MCVRTASAHITLPEPCFKCPLYLRLDDWQHRKGPSWLWLHLGVKTLFFFFFALSDAPSPILINPFFCLSIYSFTCSAFIVYIYLFVFLILFLFFLYCLLPLQPLFGWKFQRAATFVCSRTARLEIFRVQAFDSQSSFCQMPVWVERWLI